MDTIKLIATSAAIVGAIYLAIIASYILVPSVVFLFIFFVLKEMKKVTD